jgi:1-deoxy-D-xylulose-5-phosphate reductoisomerase
MAGAVGLTRLVVLGATGSIGRQTLEVAQRLGLEVVALGARRGSSDLMQIASQWPQAKVVAAEADSASDDIATDLGARFERGSEALTELAAIPDTVVVNGVVGAAGLAPSVAALEAGNRLALANKESLVAGGPVVAAALAQGGGELIPVDSEHSAIWQCLVGEPVDSVRRIILTASGGPFRGRTRDELSAVSIDDALAHPTWAMGPRITVDSATLMNKAFEVIEAHHLFAAGYDTIDVVVHPQSIVHSLVEFCDGSVKAQLGDPDMRHPISYAVTYPQRAPCQSEPFVAAGRTLTFEAPDLEVFPCLELGYEAGRLGGSAPAVLNASDEIAVAAFLAGRIPFLAIADVVAAALETVEHRAVATVAEVMDVDAEARAVAAEVVARLG